MNVNIPDNLSKEELREQLVEARFKEARLMTDFKTTMTRETRSMMQVKKLEEEVEMWRQTVARKEAGLE